MLFSRVTKSVENYLMSINVKARIKYLHRGVDLDKQKVTKKIIRGDKPVLISVGRVSKEKNLDSVSFPGAFDSLPFWQKQIRGILCRQKPWLRITHHVSPINPARPPCESRI